MIRTIRLAAAVARSNAQFVGELFLMEEERALSDEGAAIEDLLPLGVPCKLNPRMRDREIPGVEDEHVQMTAGRIGCRRGTAPKGMAQGEHSA
jgi:hypothetical protein